MTMCIKWTWILHRFACACRVNHIHKSLMDCGLQPHTCMHAHAHIHTHQLLVSKSNLLSPTVSQEQVHLCTQHCTSSKQCCIIILYAFNVDFQDILLPLIPQLLQSCYSLFYFPLSLLSLKHTENYKVSKNISFNQIQWQGSDSHNF